MPSVDAKRLIGRLLPGRFISTGPCSGVPRIALTFDDGPHPENTPRLLDQLENLGARATFFVTGEAVARAPELLRQIAANGHQVANHGFSHLNARNVPLYRYLDDIERANDLIEQTLGTGIGGFVRPPYGALTLRSFLGLVARKYRIVLWSLDTLDHAIQDAATLQHRLSVSPLRAGDIVLLHDDYAHTVQAMTGLGRLVAERGFKAVTVSDLLID